MTNKKEQISVPFPTTSSDKETPFIIAEIGNNHQGNIDKAIELVRAAKNVGADAVKFQKRNNQSLFTEDFYNAPYDNPHSFGRTYGEHRDSIELDITEMAKIKEYCQEINIHFFATPFDSKSLHELERIDCPFYKIASADIVNIPLIRTIINTGKGVILSTGNSTFQDIDRAIIELEKAHTQYALLHCTASYPANVEDMNLLCISEMKKRYKNCCIGLSDHESGIDAASIAYMLGARIFEKHFTLDHAWKGTDNAFSLMPEGMRKLVRNLHRTPILLGNSEKSPLKVEEKPIYKMRKSIVYKKPFKKGHVIIQEDLELRCPGDGLYPYEIDDILGKQLEIDVNRQQLVSKSDF